MSEYKQILDAESTETNILIDYSDKKLIIYTSRATVMNRLTRLGYTPAKINTINGEVCGMTFEFDTKDIGSFLRTGIFKFD